jgi:translation elongation factor EF-1beta
VITTGDQPVAFGFNAAQVAVEVTPALNGKQL